MLNRRIECFHTDNKKVSNEIWQMSQQYRDVDKSRLRVLLFDNLVLEVLVQYKCVVVTLWMRADESTK